MPLFRGPQWKREKAEKGRSRGQVRTLVRLCLVSLADNMKELWARDYAENYMDSYSFHYVMGPFSLLPGELVEELLAVVCAFHRASRAALHLLLVPQLRRLCLGPCSGLVTAPLCQLIALRCQELLALDLSGCQRVPPAVLAQLAGSLRRLRSLVLSGCQCDGDVVAAVAEGCPVLQHLDVSCCSGLPPWALLHLAYLPSRRRYTHHPLRSLLATDIGLGAGERESVGSAAFLLLALPWLERLGHEGAAEACALLEWGGFEGHDAFAVTHGFPTLQGALGMRLGAEEAGRRDGGGGGGSSSRANEEEVADGKEETEECLSRETEGVEEGQGEGCGSSLMERGGEVRVGGQGSGGTGEGGRCMTLRLKEVHGVMCKDLGSLGRLCPEIRALSLSCEDPACLDRRLGLWDRLAELSVQFPGSLAELLPALGTAGPRLVSLSLSGLWLDSATSLTRLLHCCPSLRALQLHPQPPSPEQLGEEEEEEEEQEQEQEDEDEEQPPSPLPQNMPHFPHLRSLTLNFLPAQPQRQPALAPGLLRGALEGLLCGSPLLEKALLISLPCCVDGAFRKVLAQRPGAAGSALLPHLRELSLAHCHVSVETARRLVSEAPQLHVLDLSGCWRISCADFQHLQRLASRRRCELTVRWK